MHRLDLTLDASKFLAELESKQCRQVLHQILMLMRDPNQNDLRLLRGYVDLWRADVGEFRIIYKHDVSCLYLILIGKRNDDEVYKKLLRKG